MNMRNAINSLQMLGASGWDADYSRIGIKIDMATGVPFAYDKETEHCLSI